MYNTKNHINLTEARKKKRKGIYLRVKNKRILILSFPER